MTRDKPTGLSRVKVCVRQSLGKGRRREMSLARCFREKDEEITGGVHEAFSDCRGSGEQKKAVCKAHCLIPYRYQIARSTLLERRQLVQTYT